MKHIVGYLSRNNNNRLIMTRLVITPAALLGVSCMLTAQVKVDSRAENFNDFGLDEAMVLHGDAAVFNALVVPVTTEWVI